MTLKDLRVVLEDELEVTCQPPEVPNATLTYKFEQHSFTTECNYIFNSYSQEGEETHGVLLPQWRNLGLEGGDDLEDFLINYVRNNFPRILGLGLVQRANLSGVTIEENEGGVGLIDLVRRARG